MTAFAFAREIQQQARILGLARKTTERTTDYERFISETELIDTTKTQYETGHFREAILNAYICLNNLVKVRVGTGLDGANLMKSTFSASNPKLKINGFTNGSEKDEQLGYMEIFSGCMTGIRNPRAHETSWPDDKQSALVLLIWANHLIKITKRATNGAE